MNLLSIDQLQSLAADPRPPASPLSAAPYLLIDAAARGGDSSDGREPSPLLAWLSQVPAPLIAVGAARTPLAAACDVHLHDSSKLPLLLGNIERHPLAATVLVQTLRLASRLPAEDALTLESLAYASLQNGAEFRRWQQGFRPPAAAAVENGPALLVEREADRLTLTLNRASQRNAMSIELRDALIEALSLALADDTVRTVTIDARGKCFSSGGELREFGTAPDPATAHGVRALALPGRLLLQQAGKTTARVHGACIGSGIEFPAFAGRVIAARDAWFQLPELRYGLIPGAGGTVSLTRRIGRQRCAWLALSGARIDARTALDWGLVDAIDDGLR